MSMGSFACTMLVGMAIAIGATKRRGEPWPPSGLRAKLSGASLQAALTSVAEAHEQGRGIKCANEHRRESSQDIMGLMS